ncbi:TPA: fimbrial biogenesis outer membrane usher protein [Stenotrophomonas maltophilia]|nr:fimbrial biogenesis outer membrane usher protein [Stenotrophomonas maltophilia]EMB2833220.1 fimbrial biogenesis outer membrane usher protein [Stenotrophomonas maltophilia]KUJ02610.1 usher protein [Stenotrophomonas maltophilia]KYK39317.1 usher protein [Stenotrophomonas maltophilia]MBA0236217.1 fimbrial biogenesis outer membrane usher protein [Stenotrophomonas maltophilia]
MIPSTTPRPGLCASRLASAMAFALSGLALPAHAETETGLEFSDGFLVGGRTIDMRRYVRGNPMPAGDYRVDVLVNGQYLQTRDITFVAGDDPDRAGACLSADLLRELELQATYRMALERATGCIDLPSVIAGATVTFDSGTLQLLISVPQAAQARAARGLVPVELRDPGINALFVDYSASHGRSAGVDRSHLGLRMGANIGSWRFRHRTAFNHARGQVRRTTINSYAQRDIPGWNSQLLLGEGNTSGQLFDSVPFTGVRIASDERMLPDSLRGYAPVVRGIADSSAVVRIEQDGVVIHEVNVAPGPFAIDDLYPTNFGGDLQVIVMEADGRQQQFTVSFSAVPQALRAGTSRSSVTAGALRGRHVLQRLGFAEATHAHGLNNRLTALGGLQLAEGYGAGLLGVAVNTPVGALGMDVTHSRARQADGRPLIGNSYRVNYQRYLAESGTNFGLAAYRYSTRGFLTLHDLATARSDEWHPVGRARQRYQLNFSQRIGERSSLHLDGGHVAYWDSTQRQNDLQLSFNTVAGKVNYGVSVMRFRQGNGRQDTRYDLTVSLPLGSHGSTQRTSTRVGRSDGGGQAQLSLTGAVGERRALNYSLSGEQRAGGVRSSTAFADYQGRYAHLSAGFTRAGHFSSHTLGAAGSIALHRGGITLGQPVGEGFALVQAPGAHGARIGAGADLRVDRRGYALLPHISPYRWNRIDLDPSGLPLEVELLQTSRRIAPTAGSIVRVPFEVRRERSLFIDATDALGQPLPFAARVQEENGTPRGAVGQGGVIHLRGAQDEGALIVDADGPSRCRLLYRMPAKPDAYGLSWTQALCTPMGDAGLRVETAIPGPDIQSSLAPGESP